MASGGQSASPCHKRLLWARGPPAVEIARYDPGMTELDLLLMAVDEDLGDPSGWRAPVEFPDSLALCALNSAYSLRGSSAAATNVLARYRVFRPTADTDSGADLIMAMDSAGGPAGFARDILRNESKLPGTNRLRPEGIYEGLSRLAALDTAVMSAEHLRTAATNGSTSAKTAWLSVKGFWLACLVIPDHECRSRLRNKTRCDGAALPRPSSGRRPQTYSLPNTAAPPACRREAKC